MYKCSLCGEPHSRLKANSKRLPADYCSIKCIKKASYYRRHPNTRSYGKSRKFWKTETGIGFKWEKYVVNKYNGKHHEFNKSGVDVTTEQFGRLDVKVCEKYRSQWVFNRNKKKSNIDNYYCICLENGKPIKELLIPTKEFKSIGITVGLTSRYDMFSLPI